MGTECRHKRRDIATKIGYRHSSGACKIHIIRQFVPPRCVPHLQRVATRRVQRSSNLNTEKDSPRNEFRWVCKIFVTGLIFWIGQVCLHSTPLECKKVLSLFYRYVAPLEQRGLFTPEAWYVYRSPDAKVPASRRKCYVC